MRRRFLDLFLLIECRGESAPVAQWIEQWIPNPCAACSIHAGGTSRLIRIKTKMKGWRLLWTKL